MRTDEELMQAFADGDSRALDALYRRYRPLLLSSLVRRCRSHSDAEDLVQQTFLRLQCAKATYRPGALVRPWIMTIAHNVRRDACRLRARRPEAVLDSEWVASDHDTFAALEARQSVGMLRRALPSLSPALRIAIELHWLEEREFGEAAELTGIREGTLRVRAHRACQVLRDIVVQLEAA